MAFRARTFSGAFFWFVDTETEAFKTDPDTRRQARRNPEPKLFYTTPHGTYRLGLGGIETLGTEQPQHSDRITFRPVYYPARSSEIHPLNSSCRGCER